MNKEDVLKELARLDEYGIDRSKYIVLDGAAMVLFGIKETTHNVDVCVDDAEYWAKRLDYRMIPYHGDKGVYVLSVSVPFFKRNGLCITTPACVELYGYRVQTPSSILMEKIKRGRDKDIEDIKLISRRIDETWITVATKQNTN